VVGGTYEVLLLPTKNGTVWDVTGLTCTITFTRPNGSTLQVSGTVIAAPAPYNTAANPTGLAYITAVSYTTIAGSTPDLNVAGAWSVDCNVVGGGINVWFGAQQFTVKPQ
jgi:hypothetical protein